MKIVEDYAQRVAQEAVKKEKEKFESELKSKDENLVINLSKEGYGVKDIARIADVSISFVNQTLSKYLSMTYFFLKIKIRKEINLSYPLNGFELS